MTEARVRYVAIIETHVGIRPHKKIAVPVPAGQSLDFDPGPGATRRWLYPYLGTDFHLVDFIEMPDTDEYLLRRVRRLTALSLRLIVRDPALALMAMERADAARAELMKRYPT